jgi:hypothetical protein
MGSVVKGMDKAMESMNLERVSFLVWKGVTLRMVGASVEGADYGPFLSDEDVFPDLWRLVSMDSSQ